jgi:hypothetical protein
MERVLDSQRRGLLSRGDSPTLLRMSTDARQNGGRTAILTAPTAAEIHREFLTTVGLPTKKAQGISCTDVPVLAGGYLTVAAKRNRDLFGVELDGGRVDLISHYPDEPVQFVNSSLPLFVFSLGLHLRDVWEFLTANPTEDPEPRIEATDRFLAVLTERDPAAVADERHFWPDMVNGILWE